MMRHVAGAGLLTTAQLAAATNVMDSISGFLSNERQESVVAENPFAATIYGSSKCPCVGIKQLSGYFATNLDYYHVQYPAETGASCGTWEQTLHPLCKDGDGPEWCYQRWCYVDPCNCETESLPGMTQMGVTFHGRPAYFSYETCGFLDLYTKEMSPDACISQKSIDNCTKKEECAWDGKRCGGKDIVEGCGEAKASWDESYGQEDCRCVGLSGREPGKAFLNINDEERVPYPVNVGSYCSAWEAESHPDCQGADAPAWCQTKWCFVDPCKCKTNSPPRIVMPANQNLKYQGKTAYWSSETCGMEDTWTQTHSTQYCVTQQTAQECSRLKDSCAWTGKECVGKALAGLCEKQEETGVLGFEQGAASSLTTLSACATFVVVLNLL